MIYLRYLLIFGVLAMNAAATDRAWTGGGDGRNWFDQNNWSPSDSYPLAGENAAISGGAFVMLSNSTFSLGDVVISNATLVFSNWTTALYATNVAVCTNGLLSLPGAFTNSQPSNRIHIVCTNFTLWAGGRIDVSGKGYGPSNDAAFHYGPGDGPGWGNVDGAGYGSGAAYGGKGGVTSSKVEGSNMYGAVDAPLAPGSGGGSYSGGTWGKGGAGGGAVWIEACGIATIDGVIQANGTNNTSLGGGGSGGGIYITCGYFAGSSGVIRANGSSAASSGSGAGGGGRIAVCYTNASPVARVFFAASPGTGWGETDTNRVWWKYCAGMGTLFLSDQTLLSSPLDSRFTDVRVVIPNFTAWNVGQLTVSNAVLALEITNNAFRMTVTNDLVVRGGAEFTVCGAPVKRGVHSFGGAAGPGTTNPAVDVGNLTLDGGTLVLGGGPPTAAGPTQRAKPALTVGGNLVLTNGGCLYVYAGVTNAPWTNAGVVTVLGDTLISTSSWVVPVCNPSNGGAVVFRLNNLNIVSNGGFNANARGFSPGYGPGKGTNGTGAGYSSGGGYGGKGGDGSDALTFGGNTYGSSNAPIIPGSGGAPYSITYYNYNSRGFGGGTIWIEAQGSVVLNGFMTADGEKDPYVYGAGAGGGIFLTCNTIIGNNSGIMRVNGGNATVGPPGSGGGGGGRIAVWIKIPDSLRQDLFNGIYSAQVVLNTSNQFYLGTATAGFGTGYSNGALGTIVFLTPATPPGTLFMFQ